MNRRAFIKRTSQAAGLAAMAPLAVSIASQPERIIIPFYAPGYFMAIDPGTGREGSKLTLLRQESDGTLTIIGTS